MLTASAPSYLVFAVNWSKPEWSALGHGTAFPPIPGAPGFIESEHIERVTLFADTLWINPMHYIFDYVVEEYNPEWVSIDVMGVNFVVSNGVITHDCVVASKEESWGAIKSMYR